MIGYFDTLLSVLSFIQAGPKGGGAQPGNGCPEFPGLLADRGTCDPHMHFGGPCVVQSQEKGGLLGVSPAGPVSCFQQSNLDRLFHMKKQHKELTVAV